MVCAGKGKTAKPKFASFRGPAQALRNFIPILSQAHLAVMVDILHQLAYARFPTRQLQNFHVGCRIHPSYLAGKIITPKQIAAGDAVHRNHCCLESINPKSTISPCRLPDKHCFFCSLNQGPYAGPDHHNVSEIRSLLVQRQDELKKRDAAEWETIYKEILARYSWGMPLDVREQMQVAVGENYTV